MNRRTGKIKTLSSFVFFIFWLVFISRIIVNSPVRIILADDVTPTLTETPTPTPGAEPSPTVAPTQAPTSTPTVTQTPVPTQTPASYSNVYISEFVANPQSGNEWAELYNNNDSEVDLYGWAIDDSLTGNWIYEIKSDNKISGKSHKKYDLGSNISLVDIGDKVRLLDGSRTVKDEKSYTSATKGKSWSKDANGVWCEVDSGTPGSANPTCPGATVTPTPKLTGSVTPTPSGKLTPTEKPEPTSSVKISSQSSQLVLGEQTTPTPTGILKAKGRFKVTASAFIISGIVLLGISGFFLLKRKF